MSEKGASEDHWAPSGESHTIFRALLRFDEYCAKPEGDGDSDPIYYFIDGIAAATLGMARGEFDKRWKGALASDVQAVADSMLRYPAHPVLRRMPRSPLKGDDEGDRFIYVFKRRERGRSQLVTLSCVIRVDGDGKYTYAETGGQARDVFSLTIDPDTMTHVYFLLSQIELPPKRIEFYRHNNAALQRRALTVSVSELVSDADGTSTLNLLDFVGVATRVQDEFLAVHEKFERVRSDEKKTASRLLFGLIESLAGDGPFSDDMPDWLNMDRVRSDSEMLNEEYDGSQVGSRNASKVKCGWHDSVGYRHARNDYTGTKELVEKILKIEDHLLKGNLYTPAGHEYAEKMAKEKSSWYRNFGMTSEELEAYRKLITGTETFWEIYHQFMVGAISDVLRSQKLPTGTLSRVVAPAIEKAHSSILVRSRLVRPADLSDLHLQNNSFIKAVDIDNAGRMRLVPQWKKTPAGILVPEHGDEWTKYTVLKKNERFWKWLVTADMEAQKLHTVVVGIELINLYLSVAELLGAEEYNVDAAISGVNAVGATADVATALIDSQRYVKAWGFFGMLGAVCDYAVATYMIVKSSSDDQPWQVQAGYGLKALGAVAIFAAVALKSGAATSILTLTSWNPILFVGVLLVLIGAAIVFWFHRAAIEKWARSSPWSIDGVDSPIGRISKTKVFEELEELVCLVLRPRIQFLWAMRDVPSLGMTRGLALRIYPGIFQPGFTQILILDLMVVYRDASQMMGIKFPVLKEKAIVIPHDPHGNPMAIGPGPRKTVTLDISSTGLPVRDRGDQSLCRSFTYHRFQKDSKQVEYIEEFWPAKELSESDQEHIDRLLRVRPILDPRLPFWGTIPDEYQYEGKMQLGLYIDPSNPLKIPENVWDKDAKFDGHVMVDLDQAQFK